MMVFNYLLEATLFGSVMILLLVAARLLLRGRLGSRAIYAGWGLTALRLLLPVSFPNPVMDEFRPGFSVDEAARPVADQVRQRVIDAGYSLSAVLPGSGGESAANFAQNLHVGLSGRWLLLAWMLAAVLVGAWMFRRRTLFLRRVRRNRVRTLEGEEVQLFEQLCARYRVKPIPVYFVDRLPSSCLCGIFEPFIGLPLNTPKEHVRLLLAQQLCHYRACDHIGGVVRCLCTAVHWFNPIVWMAAWLSYRDGEMACDDRVTARLPDLDRLAYVNVIVSAGEREKAAGTEVTMGASFTDRHLRQRVTSIIRCVRGSRWGIALGSLCAAAVLIFSFATGESEPLPSVKAVPAVSWAAAAMPMETDMEAIACVRRLLESEFVALDTSRCSFTARRADGGWLVEARCDGAQRPITLKYGADGTLVLYEASVLLGDITFTDTSYTHRTLTDSVENYVRAFVAALVPGGEYTGGFADADVRAGDVRLLMGELENGAAFALQVEPEAKMLFYQQQEKK